MQQKALQQNTFHESTFVGMLQESNKSLVTTNKCLHMFLSIYREENNNNNNKE